MAGSVRLSGGVKSRLEERRAELAEMHGVPEREVSLDDAARTFIWPEDWRGVDL